MERQRIHETILKHAKALHRLEMAPAVSGSNLFNVTVTFQCDGLEVGHFVEALGAHVNDDGS